jgi:hypothetical protein
MFNFFNSNWDDFFKFNYELSSSKESYDWEELRKKGTVEEIVEEKDGFKTITKKFTSFDGTKNITSVSSTPIIDETKQKLIEIDKQISLAVQKEDYKTAAKLKLEKDNLLKSNSNETK